MERKQIQDLFIRVCRDSGFQLSGTDAAVIAARSVGISPLEIWTAMPGIAVMDEIASGSHPAARAALSKAGG